MLRLPLAVAAAIALIALAGCGGSSPPPRDAASREAFARADANCRLMLREVRQLAKGVLNSGYNSNLELTTEGFGKPGIKLVKRIARRQQALQAAAEDPKYALYAELFDPIIVLAEQRLRAGQANELAESQIRQNQLTALGNEQREAAHRAGLRSCDVDFLDAMVRAATG